MYSLHDVKITGVSLDRILSCEIESHIGEHSTLMLSGYADNEELLLDVPSLSCMEISMSWQSGTSRIEASSIENN